MRCSAYHGSRVPAALAVLAVLLAGCECTVRDLDRWVHEDFEGCDGLCGWELVEGSAQVVRTYHPAEHALQLGGARAVVRRALEPGSRVCSEQDCQVQFAVVTSCVERPAQADVLRLGAQVTYRDLAGADVPRALQLECTTAGGTLRFCTGVVELGLPDPDGGPAWPLTALLLEGQLSGCVVDDIVLEDFTLFCGA
ncbi:MAG TPA: hypothetical protein PK668_12075 [Myxococcota bacterium]|nr:hypothetical protein [Myxococcota bacterium]HRY93795.1 hypothetical protein [Myxococcota bacterium]HSA20463.1 hypothetical protein [Myxococcota bacterium]